MNDKIYDSDSESAAKEDYDESVDYHPEKKKLFTSEQLVFSAIMIGLMVLVILIGWFVMQKKFAINTNQFRKLEARIKQFENKLAKIEEISDQIFQLETQVENFTTTMDRFDRFETSMSLKLDALNRQLASFQNTSIAIKEAGAAPKTASKKSDEATMRHHIVQAGETLYKISRQYGLTVEEMRRSNNLEANSVIYPGQKLTIRTDKKDDR
jgi:TolA-binding protein